MKVCHEHNELIDAFEDRFYGHNHDKLPMELWDNGTIYKDERTNMLFYAFRRGYALRKIACP